MTGKNLMLIMKVAMIIIMIVMVILMIIMTKMTKKTYNYGVESRPAKRYDVPESPSSPTQLTWPPLHTNVIHTHHFWRNNALASFRHL